MPGKKGSFKMYLKRAIDRALQDSKKKTDNGNLTWIRNLAARGVRRNWMDLTPQVFLKTFL